MKEIITYDVFIDETDEDLGVDRISLVKRPAIESNFILMSDEQSVEYKKVYLSDDKQIAVGAVLIPDMPIIRKDDDGEPYYIKYSAEQIEKISQQFFKLKTTKSINKDHKDNQAEGSYIYESWLVSENDKSKDLGFDVPVGTWMVSLKVEDQKLWSEIKSGKYKGFSIEGLFKFKRQSKLVKQEQDYLILEDPGVELFLNEAKARGITEAQMLELADAQIINGYTQTEIKNNYNLTSRPKNFYKYTGDLSDNSRDFCLQMIALGKYYTFEDLQAISNMIVNEGFGPKGTDTYNVWLYKGGANCKHHWEKFFVSVQNGTFTKIYGGKVAGRPGQDPFDMPKRGFLEKVELKEVELVEPKANEVEDEYISRCMSELKDEFNDTDQRYAVCKATWEEQTIKNKNINMVSTILKDGTTLYTDAEAMAVGVGVYVMEGEEKKPVLEGEYELEDGTIVVIGKESEIVEIKELEPAVEAEAEKKEENKKEGEETKMEIDPMIVENFEAIKGMLENLNLKLDSLMEMSGKVEQMETKLEKAILDAETKSVQVVDTKKVEQSAATKSKLSYDLITKYNKKF